MPFQHLRLAIVRSLALAMLLTTAACDTGNSPDQSWEYAAKGTYSAEISDDGSLAAIGSIHHGGSLWQTTTGERLFNWNHKQGDYSNIIAIGFSPEGKYSLTADHQTMVLWSTETGGADTFWTAPSEVLDIDLSNNGNFALLGLADYSAVLFDVKRGGVKRSFYHQDRVRAVTISHDGSKALTGSEDNTARLWDLQSGQQLYQFDHKDEVVTVALSPVGDKAFTVAKYDKAALWDLNTGQPLGSLPLQPTAIKRGLSFSSARFSDDGLFLLTGNSDRKVELWSVKTLKQIASWTVPKRDPWKPTGAAIVAVGFSATKGQYLAIASNGFTHRLSLK